jgi:type I restriction enzyme R subunit
MRLEYAYTAGRIIVQGSLKHRKKGKRCDYILYVEENYPIAVVEAKDHNHLPADGMQQAIDYARDLKLPFAYATNGEQFVEYDMNSGKQRTLEMNEFPTPAELKEREHKYLIEKEHLTPEGEALLNIPYYTDNDSFPPRYYQRIAINNVIKAVACGKRRMMLVMATGTGKTYTAFQIIHRLHQSEGINRVLYLADRNILIDQTMRQDFKPFRKFMTKVQGKDAGTSAEIYMSLYGQWVRNETELKEGKTHPYLDYPKDYFDLIVIDECHRSSVVEDKQYHQILDHFDHAIQIGMTATPKCVPGADNKEYFKEVVFEYSLKQGIADGFLAPFRVTKSFINYDLSGYHPEADEVDLKGFKIEPDKFERYEFGKMLNILERQKVVAHRITEMMKVVGRMTKTIVFCPTQEEALLMRELLIDMNQDMMKRNPNYIVRITSDDRVGKALLDDFIDPYAKYPVIATTSDLLTTGVDCKTCALIVIDKEVGSDTTFKQMIGRGTRIFEKKDKMSFEILDFRDATTKYLDSIFNGDADEDEDYKKRRKEKPGNGDGPGGDGGDGPGGDGGDEPKKYYVEGKEAKIVHEMVQIIGEDGRTMRTEKLTDFTRRAIKNMYPTLDAFRGAWAQADKKEAILKEMEEHDVFLDAVKEEVPQMADYDYFDIICHLAYDQTPLTRKDRARKVKESSYLDKYQGKARQIIEGLMDKFGETGVTDIENPLILKLDPFASIAKRPMILKGIFKSQDDYNKAVKELEEELYKVI